MKKINLHMLAVIFVTGFLGYYMLNKGNSTLVFFGFAENKETEVRLEHPVIVKSIYVTPGQKVMKGDKLLDVARSELLLEQSEISHDISNLESQYKIWETSIKADIQKLKAEKTAKRIEINNEIKQLESKIALNKSLIKDLESINSSPNNGEMGPIQLRIQGLKNEKYLHSKRINTEIAKLNNELKAPDNPLKIQIDKLSEQLDFAEQKEDLLSISAPSDGIIGSVFCKVEENMPGFTNFMTIYEVNPTIVKGFVLESLIVHVNEGDILMVSSSLQSSTVCNGKVIGLGSRIVEIPERLRKNPLIKTYGREVIIEIPADNDFLQNEKVILNLESDLAGIEHQVTSSPLDDMNAISSSIENL